MYKFATGMHQASNLSIEVLGIGFPNKGAELMLAAISEWAQTLNVAAQLAVSWETPFRHRSRYGLLGRVCYPLGTRLPLDRMWNFVPARLLERLGAVRGSDVDVVLDASGYAYGDPWGAAKAAQRLGGRIRNWRRQGKYIILLPQAFGPFRDAALQEQMKLILNEAHRVYARDTVSYQHLAELGGQQANVSQAPDFSCLVEGKPFAGMDAAKSAIGLIPNHKVFSMGNSVNREQYVAYFTATARELRNRGHRVALILHEGDADLDICREIGAKLGGEVPLLSAEDPREIKMAIGLCSAVLTSRFHGFASALFQGVPALATSWSHKYEQLASDFGEPSLVRDIAHPEDTAQRLSAFANRECILADKLAARAQTFKRRSKEMWCEIETLLHPLLQEKARRAATCVQK